MYDAFHKLVLFYMEVESCLATTTRCKKTANLLANGWLPKHAKGQTGSQPVSEPARQSVSQLTQALSAGYKID